MIFPEDYDLIEDEDVELPECEDWAFDFDMEVEFTDAKGQVKSGKGGFLRNNNKPYKITGIDAVGQWVRKALRTERYEYYAYSDQYGEEFSAYIGQLNTEDLKETIIDGIIDALEINPYITDVGDFEFEQGYDKLNISFLVETIYGTLEEELEVDYE